MSNNSLQDYLEGLVQEATPPLLSQEETVNQMLARERMMTIRLPILTHWQLNRAALAVGQTKTGFAQALIKRAASDAFDKLQESGHLPHVINISEAMDYYRATTRHGEPSEPAGEVEFWAAPITDEASHLSTEARED
jgi:hypothetical protein